MNSMGSQIVQQQISYTKQHLMQIQSTSPSTVYIWGLFNSKEYLTPTPQKQLANKQIIQVASGGNFHLALSKNGEIFGWGKTKYSRFGSSGQADISVPTKIALKIEIRFVAAGNWHSMACDAAGLVYAVGHNKSGACGVGHFNNLNEFVCLENKFRVESISCGDCYSLMQTDEKELWSCGHGQLHGHKSKDHLNKPKKLAIQNVSSHASGFTHSLAATLQGQVYSWGDGTFLQLGHGSKHSQKQPKQIEKLSGLQVIQVSCTRGQKNAHSMAVTSEGKVYTWGAGYKGKLGHESKWSHENSADENYPRLLENLDRKIVKVSAGGIHSNLLDDEGYVYSFGCGSNGRLGHIESKEYVYLYREGLPKALETLKDIRVTGLQSSYYHNICLGEPRK